MTLRRASFILPCQRLDDFPTHLTGERAAELLAGWTSLWHPALIAAARSIPDWRSSDELPDPSEIENELLLIPMSSRLRMAADWCDRLRATNAGNPPPVEVRETRSATIDAVLETAGLPADSFHGEVGDFLALGHAYLQVELLTRAMRYSTVLDTEEFTKATVAAAHAALARDRSTAENELARAFDLLSDARSHVYAVDFYAVDVTLLAPTTLGENLRAKLATGFPTSVLINGELLDRLAWEYPESLAALRSAIESGAACVVGGGYHSRAPRAASPEALLREMRLGQQAAERNLGRGYEVFGQMQPTFSFALPELLRGMGFTGALHAAFDGSRLPRAEQTKTWWGPGEGGAIAALAATPLDASQPATWLALSERIADTLAHDHVATLLLASYPGTVSEFFDDFRRAARFGTVLGKPVTLEEYFRISREPDEWTRFHTREYPPLPGAELGANPLSTEVNAYQADVAATHDSLVTGIAACAELQPVTEAFHGEASIVLNPWSFATTRIANRNPCDFTREILVTNDSEGSCLPGVPGFGFATFAAAAPRASIALADGRTLRNERLEVTVSSTTGGIQSIRTHRDRGTRVSQRLVFHQGLYASAHDTQMIAESVAITLNDALVGEIESRGRLVDAHGQELAAFVQRVRICRGLPAAIICVELEPQRLPEGDIWRSYYASRLATTDEAITVRRGAQWIGHETGRERIEAPDWVEVHDGLGTTACIGLGLPYHRRASGAWLDTLLLTSGEERRTFRFAVTLDEAYLTHFALGLMTAGPAPSYELPAPPTASQGWFFHIGARNVVATHIEPLEPPTTGIRVRLLETEGRAVQTSLASFRAFHTARITDFRGNPTTVLSTVDGGAVFDIGAHRWIQLEAEW